MTKFSAADVKRLRELTAAGMMDCKKALEEADGDFDKAVEVLRVKGAKDVGKREARTASNGLVTAHLDGNSSGVLLELNCETDFVAKTPAFQELAADVAAHVASAGPKDVDDLLEQASGTGGSKTVKQVLDEANVTMGEKIEVRRFARFEDGYVAAYLHKSSPDLPPTVGVLVELDRENPQVAKDVAQHIAAMNPQFGSPDEVPAETVENERWVAEQMARDEGKPEQAIGRIVEGRVSAYYKDFTLLEQAYVKDPKKSIKQVLDAAGVTVTRFARFKVGS
ncbi:MAG: translation elongation factor Ts [Actinomycetes bacterium]